MNAHACCLCSQIAGDPDRDMIAALLPGRPYARRVLDESEAFAVVPSLGALVPGHVLVCPRRHLRSFAALPAALQDELDALVARVGRRLAALHGAPHLHAFEHGMAAAGDRIVCTVDHAHLHLLPLARPVEPVLEGEWQPFDGRLATLAAQVAAAGGGEYLWLATPGRPSRLQCAAPGAAVPSQALRRAFAAALGQPQWDWRTTPDAAAADASWRRYAEAA